MNFFFCFLRNIDVENLQLLFGLIEVYNYFYTYIDVI